MALVPSDRNVSAPTNGMAALHSGCTFSSKVPSSRILRDSVRLCEFIISMRSHLSSLFLWIIDIYLVQLELLCLLMDLIQWQLAVRGLQASAVRNPHPKKCHSYHDSHLWVRQPCNTAFSNASFSQRNDIVTTVCN